MADVLIVAPVDAAQFDALLAMAGPSIAKDLLAQLRLDFLAAKLALLAAGQAMDLPQIRAQSHVILGLAGTIGAAQAGTLARDLNTAAQDPMADQLARSAMIADLAKAIDAAIAFLLHHPSAQGRLA